MQASIDAPCGAAVRVELVDQAGELVADGLPAGLSLEVLLLNGNKYSALSQEGVLRLTEDQVRSCMVPDMPDAQPLLAGEEAVYQCKLALAGGQGNLSRLKLNASSDVLLREEHPGFSHPPFRMLLWAVDGQGRPRLDAMDYLVTPPFTSATTRLARQIKPRFPHVGDLVRRLVAVRFARAGPGTSHITHHTSHAAGRVPARRGPGDGGHARRAARALRQDQKDSHQAARRLEEGRHGACASGPTDKAVAVLRARRVARAFSGRTLPSRLPRRRWATSSG